MLMQNMVISWDRGKLGQLRGQQRRPSRRVGLPSSFVMVNKFGMILAQSSLSLVHAYNSLGGCHAHTWVLGIDHFLDSWRPRPRYPLDELMDHVVDGITAAIGLDPRVAPHGKHALDKGARNHQHIESVLSRPSQRMWREKQRHPSGASSSSARASPSEPLHQSLRALPSPNLRQPPPTTATKYGSRVTIPSLMTQMRISQASLSFHKNKPPRPSHDPSSLANSNPLVFVGTTHELVSQGQTSSPKSIAMSAVKT